MPPHRTQYLYTGLLLCLFLIWINSCAHQPPFGPSKLDWTSVGSGAFHNHERSIFQGVGTAAQIGNKSLLRAAADNNARAQLAGLLKQYLNALLQFAGYNHRLIENRQAINAIVRLGLDQAIIVEHWFDDDEKRLFAQCVLELIGLKQILAESPLDDTMRSDMAARADQVFKAFVPTQD